MSSNVVSREEALNTLQSMFGHPWTRTQLDDVLTHYQGQMEKTIEVILNNGNRFPNELLAYLKSSSLTSTASHASLEPNMSNKVGIASEDNLNLPLKLKAKTRFPPYNEQQLRKIEIDMKKREKKSNTMDRFKNTWAKFKTDISTSNLDVKAVGATINGFPLNESQVTFLAVNFNVRLRDSTHYWYDKESGFFGKIGGICLRHLDPRLSIKGFLDPRASAGDTGIFVNGREILREEQKNWQRAGMVLDATDNIPYSPSFRYLVDPLGDVKEETSKMFLFNWRKQYKQMQKRHAAVGATVVGVALLGGMTGGEGAFMGSGGEESMFGGGGGGGDNFWASDVTGTASNFDSSGAGYVMFDDGSSVSIGL